MKAHKQFSNYVRLSFETDLKCLNGNVRDIELPHYTAPYNVAILKVWFNKGSIEGQKGTSWV